jgi:Na+-translocating ferredoxin:NAD+ oxidoreductase RNF subunit RnfB
MKEKCRWNPKNDCNDCPFEGCKSYGAQLEEGDFEEETQKESCEET